MSEIVIFGAKKDISIPSIHCGTDTFAKNYLLLLIPLLYDELHL